MNDLNRNIKCRKSLIDNKQIAGKIAFKWRNEFLSIFKGKNKKPHHIISAVHDSRTADRMVDHNLRKRTALDIRPYAEPVWFTQEEDFIITSIVAYVIKEDQLNH